MPFLVFVAGPIAGRRYKLGEGEYVIGRRSDCQIFVPDMRVSRQHARVFLQDGKWMVEDLGSNNGTFVNGTKIQQATLHHEDEVLIANNRIKVEMIDLATGNDRRPTEIVEVAADLVGRFIVHSKIEADHVGWPGRQQRALDLTRNPQITFEAFPVG